MFFEKKNGQLGIKKINKIISIFREFTETLPEVCPCKKIYEFTTFDCPTSSLRKKIYNFLLKKEFSSFSFFPQLNSTQPKKN